MDTIESIADRTLNLTRVFNAPRSLVFEAWTDPARAGVWFGPQGFATLSCEMDVHPGGAWRIRMQSPQGVDHIARGTYKEIAQPERLVFTWAWENPSGVPGHETLVTVHFEDEGAATKLTLRQAAFETMASRDDHQGGWSSCLDRFAAYLAQT